MTLEMRYRRLLRAYPRAYRDRRGEEMLGTLLESAAPGQTRPTRREVGDLLLGAARERLGLHALPNLESGLRLAGPVALAVATAGAVGTAVTGPGLGSTVVGAVWLLAFVLRFVTAHGGAAPALAWLVTLGVAAAFAVESPEGFIGQAGSHPLGGASAGAPIVPLGFGLLAVLASLADRPRPSTVERWVAPLSVVALVGLGAVVDGIGPLRLLAVVPVAALAAGLVLAGLRRGMPWVWAAFLLLVPTPLAADLPLAMPGVLGTLPGAALAVVFAGLFAVTVHLAVVESRSESTHNGSAALAAAGSLSLGAAAGIGGTLAALAVAGPLFPFWAERSGVGPRGYDLDAASLDWNWLVILLLPVAAAVLGLWSRLRTTAVTLAFLGVPMVAASGRVSIGRGVVLCLVLLLAVSHAVGARGTARRIVGAGLGTGALAALAYAGLLGIPLGSVITAAQVLVAPLLTGMVLAPVLVWSARWVLLADRLRAGPAAAGLAALGWLLLLLSPHLTYEVLIGLVVLVVVLFVVRVVRRTELPPVVG